MSTEQIILVANAVIIGLMILFALWTRSVINRQIKVKDATIQSEEAEISRLKGEVAPNIAKAYQEMVAHAEEMTERFNQLQEERQELEKKIEFSELRHRNWETIATIADEAAGLNRAHQILFRIFSERIANLGRQPTVQETVSVIQDATDQLVQEQDHRTELLVKIGEKLEEFVSRGKEKES